jgi:hypothetical protein
MKEEFYISFLSILLVHVPKNSLSVAIPTERPPLVGEISANICEYRVSRGQRNGSPRPSISVFQTRSRYFSIQVAPQLYSQG